MKKSIYKLILVTIKDNKLLDQYLRFLTMCAESGITAVQLREKQLPYKELLAFGKAIQRVMKPFDVPLIINDNIQLAIAINADGVHLGQTDGDVCAARQQLGNDKIIGLTIDSIDQLYIANNLPINYVGIGAIFPTHNKNDVPTVWGSAGLKKLSSLTHYPIVAIGGINESNAQAVMQAGASGIAAIDAFHTAVDPMTTTKNLRHIVEGIDRVQTP